MTSFFILLSFLIHLILFIVIYHLFEKMKQHKNEQTEQLKEMLTQFMNNIRLENDKLEQKIKENEIRQQVNKEAYTHVQNNHKLNEVQFDTANIVVDQKEDVVETSLEGQVLQLVREGKSVDEIAKQLNRGKTEVDLLIKMNQLVNH